MSVRLTPTPPASPTPVSRETRTSVIKGTLEDGRDVSFTDLLSPSVDTFGC